MPETADGNGLVLVCCKAAQLIASENCIVAVWCVGEALSVTSTVNVLIPGTVGVPEIVPVELLSVSPVGNCPRRIVQERVPMPFDAESVWL